MGCEQFAVADLGMARDERLPIPRPRHHHLICALGLALLAADASDGLAQSNVQDDLLRPGEAYVTRFSGTSTLQGPNGQQMTLIDTGGTVGSIIDIRSPARPPRGEHWYDEPQRKPVTAGEVGQVFGVVLDDASPPNIYLSATSAFGLHLAHGTQDWMEGQWGQGGGPGTIYRLSRDNGYQPSVFAQITLGGRENTGPALGNMAYDRAHKQIFVSDLETGMIHAVRASDGADLGFYDHGTIGRVKFFDAENNVAANLPAINFDPASRARIGDCPAGPFDQNPQCWNFAPSGRRIWGVGVRQDVAKNETRLYYAVWSSPTFGNEAAWNAASDDDKRNAVWSIRIGPAGNFDITDIRREFMLPDFFVQANDIARAGFSQPVSDITFSNCSDRPIMLIAERGGIRNLGLDAENPFAFPHEARALRYELDASGVWRPVGRYDVGYYDRKNEGQPFLRANCSGGIAFAPGYTPQYVIDLSKPDQFVWMTGDYLCSPLGPCHLFGAPATAEADNAVQPVAAQTEQNGDDSQVHGIQGQAESVFEELMPAAALQPYPNSEFPAYPATGPDQSYLIDTDINVDDAGNLIEAELTRNDATKIGDIAIYEMCLPRAQASYLPPPTPGFVPPPIFGHEPVRSHYRFGSHNPYWSHNRFESHWLYWSHSRRGSHQGWWSHSQRSTHLRWMSSHTPPPKRQHLVAISYEPPRRPPVHNPPVHNPPTTNSGGPGPKVNSGGPGTPSVNGGTCSQSGGITTCKNTSGWSCTTKAGFCNPQPPGHQKPGTARINSGTFQTMHTPQPLAPVHLPTNQPTHTPQPLAPVHLPTNQPTHTPSQLTNVPTHTPLPQTTITPTHNAAISRQAGSQQNNPNTSHGPHVNVYTNTGHNAPHVNVYTNTGHSTSHVNIYTNTGRHTPRSNSGTARINSGTARISHTSHVTTQVHVSRAGGFNRGGGFHPGGGGFHSAGGGGGGYSRRSDIRLKEDIVWLGRLDNGIGIYRFRYKGGDRTAYVGVMAQEVQSIVPSAVTQGADGYLRVSYDRLGLSFMTWETWRRRAGLH